MIDRRPRAHGLRRWTAPVVAAAAILLAACGPGAAVTPPRATVRVSGHVLAGPTCPVERVPPDPACAPRPVDAAHVVIVDAGTNAVIADAVTDADGAYAVDLVPGSYRLEGGADMPGIGPPQPIPFEIAADAGPVTIDLEVDTGIR